MNIKYIINCFKHSCINLFIKIIKIVINKLFSEFEFHMVLVKILSFNFEISNFQKYNIFDLFKKMSLVLI